MLTYSEIAERELAQTSVEHKYEWLHSYTSTSCAEGCCQLATGKYKNENPETVAVSSFLFLFHNKTLNVPHDTTICMENNAKTLIIHGYKSVIT